MSWEAFLDEYRALGGIAENVRLGEGWRGRGLFAIDPSLPVLLRTPNALQVCIDDVALRDGELVVTSQSYGARECAFFNAYEEHWSWGGGGYTASRDEQAAWSELPPEIIASVMEMGASEQRFAAPTPELVLRNFLDARQFARDGRHFVVPMIDLVNYAPYAPPFTFVDGIGVAGTFQDEVLVCYSPDDPWTQVRTYGFSAPSNDAYSLHITVDLPDGRKLFIGRDINVFWKDQGLRVPMVRTDERGIGLSYLPLGSQAAMDAPRGIFHKLIGVAGLTHANADRLFDSILHFNRGRFIALLRLLRKHNGPVVQTLEEAVINQLDALNACVGARSL